MTWDGKAPGFAMLPKKEGETTVDNEIRKPPCKLVGENGNAFNIIARVRRALLNDGQPERAQEWVDRATSAKSYDEVLQLVFAYVDHE